LRASRVWSPSLPQPSSRVRERRLPPCDVGGETGSATTGPGPASSRRRPPKFAPVESSASSTTSKSCPQAGKGSACVVVAVRCAARGRATPDGSRGPAHWPRRRAGPSTAGFTPEARSRAISAQGRTTTRAWNTSPSPALTPPSP
jgi:hypothetical protein